MNQPTSCYMLLMQHSFWAHLRWEPQKIFGKKNCWRFALRKILLGKNQIFGFIVVGFTETHDALTLRLSDGDLKHLLRIQRTGLTSQVLQQYWHQIGFWVAKYCQVIWGVKEQCEIWWLVLCQHVPYIFTLHVMITSCIFQAPSGV